MKRELLGKTCDEMEQGMRQVNGQTCQLYSSHWKLQKTMSCWQQSKWLKIKPVQRRRFRCRPDRLQVYIKKSIVHFRKPRSENGRITCVPPNAPESSDRAHLILFEDNEAVIKMIIKAAAHTCFMHLESIVLIYIGFWENQFEQSSW